MRTCSFRQYRIFYFVAFVKALRINNSFKIKNYRRIATRYDKTAIMFMGALTLTGILMWLKL